MRDVRDGAFVGHEIILFGVLEVLLDDAVQTTCLVLISPHSIFNVFGSISSKVVCLAWR